MEDFLFVIGVISNPVGWKSRVNLYKEFQERMRLTKNVILITVELAMNDDPFVVTDSNDIDHIQLRAGPEAELWVKESLINIGVDYIKDVYPDYKYLCWTDGDITFLDDDWANKTIEALQTYKVIQPWSTSNDLGPNKEILKSNSSFCYMRRKELEGSHDDISRQAIWHPGYSWAMRRETFEAIGGLIDYSPVGTGDLHMAWAFIGNMYRGILALDNDYFMIKCHNFKLACDQHIGKDGFGYIHGTIQHHWHGSKKNRFYENRFKMLKDAHFDVDKDLTKNKDGLVVLSGHNKKLATILHNYFLSRNEDSTDL